MPQPPQRMCFGLTMVVALLGFTGTLARRLSLEASCPSNPPGIAAEMYTACRGIEPRNLPLIRQGSTVELQGYI